MTSRIMAVAGAALTVLAAFCSRGGSQPIGTTVESLTATALPIGDVHCPAGGSYFVFNDGKTAYVCNGQNGIKGDSGAQGLQGLQGDPGLPGPKVQLRTLVPRPRL